ncbi:glycerate kinase, partial [Bordetella petrii]|uniref:glycerate kinase n=1 Tax=Bordetella petrii TaxID=94624 RepID=UPI001E3C9372
MKIVIAPDSFKESLSAPDAAAAIERGIKQAFPGAQTLCVPMADGGEGTVAAVLAATGGQWRSTPVTGALGESLQAAWGWLGNDTAVIEEFLELRKNTGDERRRTHDMNTAN